MSSLYCVSCYDTSWSTICPTPHHHDLVPREDSYQAVKTSSCHATDDIPGVSDWVIFVDVVGSLPTHVQPTNSQQLFVDGRTR